MDKQEKKTRIRVVGADTLGSEKNTTVKKKQQMDGYLSDDALFRMICGEVSGDPDKMPQDHGMQREIVHRYEGAKWMRDRMG